MDFESQIDALFLKPNQAFDIDFGTARMPVRFRAARKPSRNLIIHFHGDLNKQLRPMPYFLEFKPDGLLDAHEISIADPSIQAENTPSLAWFSGHSGFAMQSLFPQFVTALKERLGVERLLFAGGSGGGFAALYYSWHFADSIALVLAPQTVIARHYQAALRSYRSLSWPELAADEPLDKVICANVCDLYRKSADNLVIYLISMGDRWHFHQHLTPFLDAVGTRNTSGVILECGYWGVLNHSNSIPFSASFPWFQAALASDSLAVADVITTRHALGDVSAPAAAAVAGPKAATFNAGDLRFADLLRDRNLRDSGIRVEGLGEAALQDGEMQEAHHGR